MTGRLVILLALASLSSASLECSCGIENLDLKQDQIIYGKSSRVSITHLPVLPRIWRGKSASRNRYPWMVSLVININEKRYGCGGTIINDRYILTAAHCLLHKEGSVSPDHVEVILGAHTIAERKGRGDGISILAAEILKIHPRAGRTVEEQGENSWYDIALIKLKEPLTLNGTLRPICLANFKNYQNLFSIGWGNLYTDRHRKPHRPHELQEVDVDEVDTETCQCYYDELLLGEKQICAGTRGGACRGDSGGPMSTRMNGRVYQVGITSFGLECAENPVRKAPDVYVRITGHLNWIRESTTDALWCGGSSTPIF